MTLTHDPNNGCCVAAPPAAEPKPPTTAQRYAAMATTHRGPLPTFPTMGARKAFVRSAIATRAAWVYRALVLIFGFQTADEQASDTTTDANGQGFTGHDAEFLSSLAKQYLAKQDRFPGQRVWLSPKQEAALLRAMPKYAQQIIDHMVAQATPGIEIVRQSRKAGA